MGVSALVSPRQVTQSLPPTAQQALTEPTAVPEPPEAVEADLLAATVVPGARLDAYFASLPPYRGGALRMVKVAPGRYVRTRPLKIPSGVHLIASGATFVSSVPGREGVLLDISGRNDIVLEGGVFDGNQRGYRAASEWRHAIRINASKRVTLRGVVAQNAKGDGIYIGVTKWPCERIVITRCRATGNARNGLSVTSCRGLVCDWSTFDHNGSAQPKAGVDVEPHSPQAPVEDLLFRNCTIRQNGWRGFLYVCHNQGRTPRIPAKGVTLINCSIVDNGRARTLHNEAGGLSAYWPRRLTVIGGTISRNEHGITIQGDGRGYVNVTDVTVDSNRGSGLRINRPTGQLQLTRVKFTNNSKIGRNRHDGMYLVAGNMTAIQCVVRGRNQRYGLNALRTARNVVLRGCSLTGNRRGSRNLARGSQVSIR